MSSTARQDLLRRALEFISLRDLSMRLKVPPATIEDWMSGRAPMPDRALVRLSEILNEITRPG